MVTQETLSLRSASTFSESPIMRAFQQTKQFVGRRLANGAVAALLLLPPSGFVANSSTDCDYACRVDRFARSKKVRVVNDHFVGVEYWAGNCALGLLNGEPYDKCVTSASGHAVVRPWR